MPPFATVLKSVLPKLQWAIRWSRGTYETFEHESTARFVLREKFVKEGWVGRVVQVRVHEEGE